MRYFARVAWCALAVYLVAGTGVAGCGNTPKPVEQVAGAPMSSTGRTAPSAVPVTGPMAAASTCAPRLGHAAFGTQSCESCHPCGTKSTTGHPTGWVDTASSGFHAYQANSGIATCQGCHGVALDGVGGSATTSCAQCHGASWKTNCVMCHGGTDSQTGAPPKTTWGNAADAVRVGAHTAHAGATHGLAAPVACAACHVQPADALATGHVDGGTAEVLFSGLATQGTPTAAWARATASCSSTYCHGATLRGGTATTPVWTTSDGTQRACNSCHGAPPPAPHVNSAPCGSCHPGYTATTVAAATHVDGKVDVVLGPSSCSLCHGAPPATASHRTAGGITTCSRCHDTSVDATGNILAGGTHRNGAVNLSASMSCASCHGSSTRTPSPTAFVDGVTAAPPVDLSGNTTAAARGVGAHLVHVNGTRSKNLLCSDCHDITTSFQGYGHANGVTDMAWGTLARMGGAAPTYTLGSGGSCNATYCHGNFAGGSGAGASPAWTMAATLACNSCHGAPPALSAASHHPANANCGACHGTGYSATTVVQAIHVDGAVNLSRAGCTLCHGDLTLTGVANTSALSAPGYTATAADTAGNVAATSAAVGAHATHLAGTRWRSAPIACGECHAIPATGDVAHASGVGSGGARATIVFGPLARTGGITTALYAGSTTASGANGAGTCSNTYCHGNFKNGATTRAPSWLGGAAGAACGSCHGLPPGGTHPANSACVNCHSGYTATTVNLASHMNGVVNVANMTCTSCHGAAGRASVAGADLNQASSPPNDTLGAAAGVRVGTHLAHVNPAVSGQTYKAIACVECHPDHTGNISHSNSAVNVTFATATGANLGAFTPTFVQGNGTTTQTTCATYCHGSSLNATTTRGSVASWTWNGAAADCGSCHKSPPGTANHHNAAALTTCANCHGGTVSAAGVVNVAGGLHVNGVINTSTLTCTTCHGGTLVATGSQDPNVGAAPRGAGAPDTYGNTTVAFNGVGVHAAHVLGTRSRPVLCNACHTVPGTQIHKTGVVTAGTVALANLSITGGITTATYAGNGSTCSNTYCHGNLGGGVGAANVTPTWRTSATLVCNSCHGMPPSTTSTGRFHPNRTDCGACHNGYTGTTVNAATHVNGVVDYTAQTCTSCHGTSARTGSDANLVAFSSAPPVDASNASTGAKVGAHVRHLLTGAAGGPSFSKQVACSECHNAAIPATPLHANGLPNVAFGTLARTGAVTPSYTGSTCSNTYCHGNFQNGAGANAITWNAGAITCNSCHGTPPGGTHPAGSTLATCGNCHGNYSNATQSIINPALHVDGTVDVSGMTCTSCHGTTGRTSVALADANQAVAPPVVASATGVAGVHLAHVNQGATAPALSLPILCTNCHVVPSSNSHSNGVIGVTYAGLSVAQGAVPTAYNPTAHTCSNTYCHGNFPGGNQSATAISWSTSGKLGCTACHGNPPAISTHHPANTNCVACHTGYSNTTVTAATHVDGTVQKPANGCTACHGVLAGQAGAAVANTSPTSAPGFNATAVNASGSALTTSRGVGAHLRHLTPTLRSAGLSCTECHGPIPAANDTTHANGTVAVAWGTLATTRSSVPTTSVAGSTLSCSATWCHGGNAALSGATAATIAWNANATVNCTSCHGNPPAGLGHPASTACATCHGTGYTYLTATTGSITGAALATHIDGVITVTTPTTCTSCHGTTARASGGIAGVTYDANQAAAPPNDTRGASASVLVGAHAAHVNPTPSVAGATQPSGGVFRPIACIECHPNNATNNHGNGVINFTFAGATAANLNTFTPTFTQGNGTTATTCATYCHGAKLPNGSAGSASMAWNGAATTCASCHGFPPASHAAMTNATQCATCHSETVTSTGTINIALGKHINGVVDGGGEPSNGGSSCGGCHAAYFNQMTAATPPRSRHGLGSDLPQDGAFNWTGTDLNSSVALANRTCVTMCHSDHPHTLTSPATTTHENNVYLDATTQTTRASGSATRIGSGAGQNRARTDFDPAANAGVCTSCHQRIISTGRLSVQPSTFGASAHDYTSNTVGATNYAWTSPIHDGSTFVRNCTKCHASRVEGNTPTATTTQTVHFSADDVHLLAGTTNPAGTPANFACYNCHGSTATPAAGAQGNRSGKDIQTQVLHATTANQSGHPSNSDTVHDTGPELANAAFGNALGVAAGPGQRHANCMDCHDPHAARAGTDPAAYTTGTVSISTTTATCPTTMGGGTACGTATGTGTTWTAAMVGWKMLIGTASYTVVQYTSATSVMVFPRPTTAVSSSAYTLKLYYRATNVAGAPVQGAWGAQLSTNPAFWTAPTTVSFTKQTITAGTSLEATLCFKCHTGYYWGTGTTPVSPSGFTYVTGTASVSSGGTAVTGSGTTWTAAHVGANIKNNTLGVWHRVTAFTSATSITISPAATAAWSGAYTIQMAESDAAREFNPANVGTYATAGTANSWSSGETAGGFHPILATASGNLGATGNILPPFSRTSLMQCTDCHDSDSATDPNGPHGSASKFILKGPNTTWSNAVVMGSTGMPAGTFCANCHRADFAGSRFTQHFSRSDHRLACFNCHAAVPHGGPRPGMLVAGAGAATGVGGTIAGWDNAAPYWQGGTTNRLYIASYPATNTTAWSQGNCGCNGTGH